MGGPCKMIGPIFEEVAGELTNAKFTKVNVDECPNLAGKYRVASIYLLSSSMTYFFFCRIT